MVARARKEAGLRLRIGRHKGGRVLQAGLGALSPPKAGPEIEVAGDLGQVVANL